MVINNSKVNTPLLHRLKFAGRATLVNSIFILAAALGLPFNTYSQVQPASPSPADIKNLSIEELMNLEVTSVSKRPEKLTAAASAIQVITWKDINSSGAKTLPEALRLASNLQVAQVNASQWAISARGFNNVLANKLLVLIDGRTVYTPLYAGVFWDVQNVLLEDVERIEVISGPGGTLWGANAVNGVINIITKNSKDSQGLFAEVAAGTTMPGQASLRYGAKVGKDLAFKLYGTGFEMGNTMLNNGTEANDHWNMLQGGIQVDWEPSLNNQVTVQQNINKAKPNPNGGERIAVATGNNIMARWNHQSSEKLDFQLQAYYDQTGRDYPNGLIEDLKTFDIDGNSRFQVSDRHILSFGLGYRLMDHRVENLPLQKFLPESKRLYLPSLFIQDEIHLIKDRLRLTLGSKLEHNSYTGYEFQPNGRLAWSPVNNQTVWAAISRAVRTPARIDRDFSAYLNPTTLFLTGSEYFRSEELLAYELGWRAQPLSNLTTSLALFHHVYDHIRSAEPPAAPASFPISFGNGVEGKTYGLEISSTLQVNNWWNVRGGYTFLKKDLSLSPGSRDLNAASAESNDPANQLLIQSNWTLPARFEIGTVFRYVDNLPKPYVPEYFGLDVKVGWHLNKAFEFNIVGQNLLDNRHPEFIPASPSARQIQQSVYGKLTWRY